MTPEILSVAIDALPDLSFAMVESSIALVPLVLLTNAGAEPLTDLTVGATTRGAR